jgi:glycine oxidase
MLKYEGFKPVKKYLWFVKNVEYLIVGFGIAGLSFAETLRRANKSFVVIADKKDGATTTSGGVLNPTVLKRFTAAWRASEFQQKAIPFYKEIERHLNEQLISEVKIERILNSIEEQNDWMIASDRNELKTFLNPSIESSQNDSVVAPFKLGAVKGGHLLSASKLLASYAERLRKEGTFIEAVFDYSQVTLEENKVHYKEWEATRIVFAEGAKVIDNPFYPYQGPFTNKSVFIGNKGDYVIVKAPKLKVASILKGGMMLIPLGDDLYKIGATYDRHVYDSAISMEKREEIFSKLNKMISCPFEVVAQVAGVRPTIKDRRPLTGALRDTPQVAFLNGLGTRGLSMAPLVSLWLFQQLEEGVELPSAIDINRFLKP